MKRRVRRILNFFAFNLLFFALYLNFIHKDKVASANQPSRQVVPTFTGTVLVDNPEKFMDKKPESVTGKVSQENGAALKAAGN